MKNPIRALTLALVLAAALVPAQRAAAVNYKPIPLPDIKLTQQPELGVPAEAEIGKSMVAFSREALVPAISVVQDVTSTELGIRLTIPAGKLFLIGVNPNGKFYEHLGPVRLSSLGTDMPNQAAGLFVPSDPNAPMQTYRYMAMGLGMRPVGRIPFVETTASIPNNVRFRIEFIYAGVINNVMSFTYREFTESMTQPSYTQDLKFDISMDKVIGFKGARIQVLSANNTSVSYIVQKGFDEVIR